MVLVRRLLVLLAAVMAGSLAAQAEEQSRLAVAIGTPGSDSFTFGTELWAMGQIALLPSHDIVIDQREVSADGDRLSLLQSREVEGALVYGRIPDAYDEHVRAIMALWPEGVASEDADPVQFLVHKDVSEDVVYLLTKAMFEHASYFRNAHASLGVGRPSEATKGLDTPLHAGAFRYYDESGFGLSPAVVADYWDSNKTAAARRTAASYRNFDDDALAPDEVEQIAAACRHALEIGSLSVLLGDLDNTGCEVYQDRLIDRTAGRDRPAANTPQALATSVPPADGDGGLEAQVGQGGPAIRWTPPKDKAGTSEQPMPTPMAHQPIM